MKDYGTLADYRSACFFLMNRSPHLLTMHYWNNTSGVTTGTDAAANTVMIEKLQGSCYTCATIRFMWKTLCTRLWVAWVGGRVCPRQCCEDSLLTIFSYFPLQECIADPLSNC